MKVTILIPTLNEIDGCRVILPQIRREWYDQLLIVDGGSTDGTPEWCEAHGYEVYAQRRPGIRHAYIEALPLVRGDVILTMSPDGNCNVSKIPDMLDMLLFGMERGICDLVIGSRYRNCRSEDDDWITGFGNWLFTKTVNVLHVHRHWTGVVTDAMVIYRCFPKSLIYELELDCEESYRPYERLFRTTISWEPLMTVRAAKCYKRILEVSAGEPPRIGGQRKLQIIRWGLAYYCQFWRELWCWR